VDQAVMPDLPGFFVDCSAFLITLDLIAFNAARRCRSPSVPFGAWPNALSVKRSDHFQRIVGNIPDAFDEVRALRIPVHDAIFVQIN